MAEGLLRYFAGEHFDVYGASLESQGVNPHAIQATHEIGLDINGHQSKSVMDCLGRVHMSMVISVCSKAEERCPIFPFSTQRLYWPFEAPATSVGTPDETLQKVRDIRDQISERLQAWLQEQDITPRRLPTRN